MVEEIKQRLIVRLLEQILRTQFEQILGQITIATDYRNVVLGDE